MGLDLPKSLATTQAHSLCREACTAAWLRNAALGPRAAIMRICAVAIDVSLSILAMALLPPDFTASHLPRLSGLYPLYGVAYFFRHQNLHGPVRSRIVPLTLLSIFVLAVLFSTLYLPLVVLLAFFYGPWLAFSQGAIMVLSGAATLVAIIAEAFLTEKQQVEVFDRVWLAKAEQFAETDPALTEHMLGMMRECRELQPRMPGGFDEWRLGEHRVDPYVKWGDSLKVTAYFVLELPLNLLPVVGTPLFLALQGYHLGPLAHYRYFQLRALDRRQKKRFIRRERPQYFLFGLTHVLLQLVPVLSILFLFTTATGAALWAVEYEKRLWGIQTGTPPSYGTSSTATEDEEAFVGESRGRRWWRW